MWRLPSERSPVKVLLLTLITCGLYYPYWMYVTVQDIDEFLGQSDLPPIVHVLLWFFTGSLWGFAFDFLTARRVMEMQQRVGLMPTDNSILYIVFDALGVGPCYGLGIVSTLMEQSNLNEIYRAAGAGTPNARRIRMPIP